MSPERFQRAAQLRRPRSRNVKLTLFSYCKAQVGAVSWAASRHGAVWLVELAQGAILVCVDRLMGPEPRTGTWGLAANIPQQGCSKSRTPFQSLATLDSRGRSLRYRVHQLSASQTWKSPSKPPLTVACGARRSAALLPMLHHYVLSRCSVAFLHVFHALHLPHTIATAAGSHHFLRLAPSLAIDANIVSHRPRRERSMPANPGLAPPLLLFPPGSPYYRPRDPLTTKS